jgi:uncharacterized membrane protein YfcA
MSAPATPDSESTSGVAALQTAAIGALAGAGSGLLGVGGGIVMVPLLTAVIGLSQHRAHATSLAAIVPIGLAGAITYAVHGEVDVGQAVPIAIGAALAAPLGARVMHVVSEGTLTILFGSVMLIVGVRMLIAG